MLRMYEPDRYLNAFLSSLGVAIPAPGDIQMAYSSDAATPYGRFRSIMEKENIHSSVTSAYNKTVSGRNDVVLLTPESHSQGSMLTWANNMTHLVGMYPSEAIEHQRSRMGMSTAFSPFLTVSGYGNLFANLYTMHGTAQADYIGWTISGNRNTFKNVHFGGPFFGTQADHASYRGVNITGTENYFLSCMFGDSSKTRNAANYNVQIAAGKTAYFKDCTFRMYVDGADSMFVNFMNSAGATIAYFENCLFYVLSDNMATSIDEAFNFTAAFTALAMLDSRCNFVKVTKIASSANDVYVYLARPHVTTTIGEGNIAEVLVS